MNAPKAPRRAEELNYFNAIACLMVILIHVLSVGISGAEPTSWQLLLIFLPWKAAACVVPAFLFSGAVKLALQWDHMPSPGEYGTYILGRLRKIYLPYVVWNTIYYLAFLPIGYVRGSLKEFLSYLWIGNLSSPFYYVVIVMQFYLLLPLWVWLVKRVPWYCALGTAVLVTLLSQQFSPVLQLMGIDFAYLDRVFPSYLLFWVGGLYVGKSYDPVSASLRKNSRAILFTALPVAIFLLFSYWQFAFQVYALNLNYFKPFSDCLSILLLLTLCIAIRDARPAWAGILRKIHAASFFVYLSHCLFLTMGTLLLNGLGVSRLSALLLLRLLICYTCPFLLFWLWSRCKGALSRLTHP